MGLAKRPGLRLAIEAVVIVLAAAVTGFVHAGAWAIAAAVFLVWTVAAVVEYSLAHQRDEKPPAQHAGARAEDEPAPAETPKAPVPPPMPAEEEVRGLPRTDP